MLSHKLRVVKGVIEVFLTALQNYLHIGLDKSEFVCYYRGVG